MDGTTEFDAQLAHAKNNLADTGKYRSNFPLILTRFDKYFCSKTTTITGV